MGVNRMGERKHKVPPAYERAEDNARSLTALGMTIKKRTYAQGRSHWEPFSVWSALTKP
jgi:hypothetical protein